MMRKFPSHCCWERQKNRQLGGVREVMMEVENRMCLVASKLMS